MEDFDLDIVARKSVRGIFALVSRTFFIQVLSIAASFILTIFLDPGSYGVFFVVSSIVVFLTYFQDIGLAAALIQKKEEVTKEELRATFTLQQILVLLIVIPVLIFSKDIAAFYKLNASGYTLLLSLTISFFLSSLRTIPTVILERKLDFNKLVIPQIAENLVYNLALIYFSISGYGITTFTIAVIGRSVVGLVLTYFIQPWPIGLSFNFRSIKSLISFGIPFQANTILALIKDDLLTVYVGKILPFSQVGYIGFAQKWAFMPLRLIMDNVIKITFPSISRLQHDKDAMRLAVEKSLFLVSFFIFPIAAAIISYSPFLIDLIPKYKKWEPAILSLSFFALNTIFSSISTPLTNFLTAIGRVKITLYFMVFWTIATWILTPLLITFYGFNGFAGASFLISISSISVFFVAKRFIDFSILRPVLRQFLAAILMFTVIQLTKGMINSFPTIMLNMILASVLYLGILIILAREELVKTVKFIIISVRSKN
ncbi:MAG: oligosaccharide flippase family protein [bacterium]|nr:oligosaccharide flippase family protein [bacterium]